MTVDLVLTNAKIFTQGHLVEGGVAIDEGRIVKIAKDENLPQASKKTNLGGNIIIPGLIDSHVHLRDQKLAYKESFFTGTAAAAVGGVTSVIDMPNNKPVTTDSSSLKERMKKAEEKILVNVAFNSAFPKNPREIREVVKQGAVGFKIYMSHNVGGLDVNDYESLFMGFREVADYHVPVAVHAEDQKFIEEREKEMLHAGRSDIDAFLYVHSSIAEVQSIHRVIPILKKAGVSGHFCHVSSASGVSAILEAKKEGLPVTFEVTPHNLFLSSENYRKFGSFALTVPPLRSRDDVSVLFSALKCGIVDVVASDHAPHCLGEKTSDSVWDVKPGVPGLETILSLLLNQVCEGNLSFAEVMRVTSEGPAKIFNLSGRGLLKEGYWADLVVVDMKRVFKVDSLGFFSKAKYSPFDGMVLKGRAVKTFVNGVLVMDDGEIVASLGCGHVIKG